MFVTAQKIHPVFNYLNLFRTAPVCFSVYQKLHQRYAYIQEYRETRCFQSDFSRYRNMNFFNLKNHKPYIYSFMSMQRFHTSNQCRALPFMECVMLIQVAKLTVIILGRKLNKWLKIQTDTLRSYYRRRLGFLCLIGISLAMLTCGTLYQNNLEDTPVTGRKRYITTDQEQMFGQFEAQFVKFVDSQMKVLPATNSSYKRVADIIKKLVESNQDYFPDLKAENFTVKILRGSPLLVGTSHTGEIVMTKEFLNTCSKNDETAVILGHELAHYALSHPAERFSFLKLVNFIYITGVMVPIWFFIPRLIYALLAQLVCMVLKYLLVYQPSFRQHEKEADIVGLQMMAKACYDARAATVIFTKFAEIIEEIERLPEPVKDVPGAEFFFEIMECFASHPSLSLRLEYLDRMIPEVMKLRKQCNCPRLKSDPRREFYATRHSRKELLAAWKKMQDKIKKKISSSF